LEEKSETLWCASLPQPLRGGYAGLLHLLYESTMPN
jgi:hypothetical protein